MDVDCDKIALNKQEVNALRALEKSDILITKKNAPIFERLHHYTLIEVLPALGMKSDYGTIPKCAHITDPGKDYIAYLQEQKKSKKRSFQREAFLAIIGAAVGSLFTLFIEHFAEIIRVFKFFLQNR